LPNATLGPKHGKQSTSRSGPA